MAYDSHTGWLFVDENDYIVAYNQQLYQVAYQIKIYAGWQDEEYEKV